MSEVPKQRRSLTHVGGRIETEGDTADAQLLARALDVAASTGEDEETSRAHVHGFHTYPARMHPDTAARLVRSFVPEGGKVLDPFCGSGTVLVEALIANRRPFGTDLNPLAVMLARSKARPRTPAELEQLVAHAKDCAASADQRRKAKAGASRRFTDEDISLYDPHILMELDSLRIKVETLRAQPVGADLALVLSAVLVKLSRKRGDTSQQTATRRLAAGFPARLFVQKAEEYAERLAAFAKLLPSPPPQPAFVAEDDATALRSLPVREVDAVITSPPYAATYDYLAHHALRLRWLGLDAGPLQRGELGSRSAYQRIGPRDASAAWERELGRFFTSVGRGLPRGAPLVLMMADSAVGTVALRADEIVAAVARASGFRPAARASQARPHFHGPSMAAFRDRPRAEHAILLRRDLTPAPQRSRLGTDRGAG